MICVNLNLSKPDPMIFLTSSMYQTITNSFMSDLKMHRMVEAFTWTLWRLGNECNLFAGHEWDLDMYAGLKSGLNWVLVRDWCEFNRMFTN